MLLKLCYCVLLELTLLFAFCQGHVFLVSVDSEEQGDRDYVLGPRLMVVI